MSVETEAGFSSRAWFVRGENQLGRGSRVGRDDGTFWGEGLGLGRSSLVKPWVTRVRRLNGDRRVREKSKKPFCEDQLAVWDSQENTA